MMTCIFQFEINRKRDTELNKLRKLLEDVHLESEETAHLLKKKHQEIVADFQDQIDQLTKSKARWGHVCTHNTVFLFTDHVFSRLVIKHAKRILYANYAVHNFV